MLSAQRLSARRVCITASVLAVSLVGVAACGGSSHSSSPTSTAPTPTTAPASTTPTTVSPPVAMTALLRLSDLPAGWKDTGVSSAQTTDTKQLQAADAIPACQAFASQVRAEEQLPKVSSNTFQDAAPVTAGTANEVSNDVVTWPSAAAASAAFAAYNSEATKTCLLGVFQKLLASSAPVGTTVKISLQRLTVAPVGDAALAYAALLTITSGTTTQQAVFTIEVVRVGRYTVSYNGTLYQPAPALFAEHLVGRSVARLQLALHH